MKFKRFFQHFNLSDSQKFNTMGLKLSTDFKDRFQYIEVRDFNESNIAPINQQTSLEIQAFPHSYEGPVNGQIGEFTGLQKFFVHEKYSDYMKASNFFPSQDPLKCQPPNIKGVSGIDPYMFKKSLNVYYGEWKNGMPHGYGKLFNPDQDYYYEGYFQGGLPSYYGVFLNENIQYEGQFKHGRTEGNGKYRQGLKTIQGMFKENFPDQNCIQSGQNYTFTGNYQEGIWKEGKIVWGNDKSSYEGEFQDGLMHGFGKLELIEFTYEGHFKQGKKHGKGKIIWNEGDQYTGQFFQDQLTGHGELYKEGKLVYRGYFSNGMPNGEGWVLDHERYIHANFNNGTATELL